MKIHIFLLSLLVCLKSFAAPKEDELKKVFAKLRSSPMVTLEVQKTTKSELLGNESVAPGTIYLSSDKFRWDTAGSENSKIIYDGKMIWTVQEPPKGFKAPPQISRMKLDKKSEGQVFLKSLFQEKYGEQFNLKKKSKDQKGQSFVLVPKQNTSGIKEVQILISDKNEIKEFAYTDEVQNKTTVQIQKVKPSSKVDPKIFVYKPPTGVQVNDL